VNKTQEFAMAKTAAAKPKPMSKSEVFATLAEKAGVSKKEVANVFDALTKLIEESLGKRGSGMFNVPGLMKISVVHKPATKARKGINPFTKQEQMFKAKPARNVVKVRPLKALKDMV
jgi:nucleoid DNA-binding protein